MYLLITTVLLLLISIYLIHKYVIFLVKENISFILITFFENKDTITEKINNINEISSLEEELHLNMQSLNKLSKNNDRVVDMIKSIVLICFKMQNLKNK